MVNPLREEFAPADVNFFSFKCRPFGMGFITKEEITRFVFLGSNIGGKEGMGFQARA